MTRRAAISRIVLDSEISETIVSAYDDFGLAGLKYLAKRVKVYLRDLKHGAKTGIPSLTK